MVSCTKEKPDPVIDNHSVVMVQKYPCGQSCDAQAWIIQTGSGTFEVVNLPSDFEQDQLPVKVEFYRTGTSAPQWQGTGNELVRIVAITRR